MSHNASLNFQEVRETFLSNKPQEHLDLLETLNKFPLGRKLLEIYIDNLQHKSWTVRKLSAERLKRETGIAFSALNTRLTDRNPDLRFWAIQILPEAGEKAIEPLVKAYQNLEHSERLFILDALTRIKSPAVIPFALEQLNHELWSIRKAAFKILLSQGVQVITALKEAIREGTDDQRYWCFKALGKISGTGAMQTFINILGSTEYEEKIRSYALSGVGEISSSEIIPHLITTLDSDLWSLRAQASKILIKTKFEPHRQLIEAMRKGSRSLRYWGSQILSEIVEEKHLGAVEECIRTRDLDLRYQAMSIAGKVKSIAAVDILSPCLMDPVWYIRKHASDLLTSLGAVSVIPLTNKLSSATDEEIFWLCKTLGNLNQPLALGGLATVLKHESKEVRLMAMEAIGQIGGKRGTTILMEALDNDSWVLRSRAHDFLLKLGIVAFPNLFEGLTQPSESVRFWTETTIEASEFFGAKALMNFIRKGTERETQDILDQLYRLRTEALSNLLSREELRPQDVLQLLKEPANLVPSARFQTGTHSCEQALDFSYFQKSEYPFEQSQRFHELLKESVELGGTQLHLRIGSAPMVRVEGNLCQCSARALTAQDIQEFFSPILSEVEVKTFHEQGTLEVCIPFEDRGRFKVHLFRQGQGVEAVLHYGPSTVPNFESLQYPSDFFAHIAKLPHGLVLVSGPSGSGKTSCCISLLNHINQQFVKNIITIEDRVEYPLKSEKSLISQRELGRDLKGYRSGVEALMHEDPDVAYLARIPQSQSLESVLQLASSQALVLLECNASSTREALEKVLLLFPQKLLKAYEKLFQNALQASIHIRLVNDLHHSQRIPALEYFLNNSRLASCLSLDKLEKLGDLLRDSDQEMAVSMDDYLLEMASKKQISYQEAVRWMEDKSRISVDHIW
jgi:twitching motility protein PilT